MFDQFKNRAEAVGAEVHRFRSKDEALAFILQFLRTEGLTNSSGNYAVWADGPFLGGIDTTRLAAENPGLSFEVSRQLAADARIGMKRYLADTNVLSEWLRKRPDPAVIGRLEALSPDSLFSSEITRFELKYGACLHPDGEALWQRIERRILPRVTWLSFDESASTATAALLAKMKKSGTPIGPCFSPWPSPMWHLAHSVRASSRPLSVMRTRLTRPSCASTTRSSQPACDGCGLMANRSATVRQSSASTTELRT